MLILGYALGGATSLEQTADRPYATPVGHPPTHLPEGPEPLPEVDPENWTAMKNPGPPQYTLPETVVKTPHPPTQDTMAQ